jgi:hypothetical protein
MWSLVASFKLYYMGTGDLNSQTTVLLDRLLAMGMNGLASMLL